MNPYGKIFTAWTRDKEDNYKTLVPGNWKLPIFEYLKDNSWNWYEKIDGTNVRVSCINGVVIYNGRRDLTDRSGNRKEPQFHGNLWDCLRTKFTAEWFGEIFADESGAMPAEITLYGEGFGAGINGGPVKGHLYGDISFCLFDVMINGLWLLQGDVTDISDRSDTQRAPYVGKGTLEQAIDATRQGFNSKWGDFQAEGLILRPAVPCFDRFGQRVISKVKCEDFPNG